MENLADVLSLFSIRLIPAVQFLLKIASSTKPVLGSDRSKYIHVGLQASTGHVQEMMSCDPCSKRRHSVYATMQLSKDKALFVGLKLSACFIVLTLTSIFGKED